MAKKKTSKIHLEEIDDQIDSLEKEEGKFLSFLNGSSYCDDINIDAS